MVEWVVLRGQGQRLPSCLLQEPGGHLLVGTMFLLVLCTLFCMQLHTLCGGDTLGILRLMTV